MHNTIHPTAIVEPGAQLGANVSVGAYAYIGPHVRLGDGCIIEHHATVDGHTTMGTNNHVYPYSFIGAQTHDLKFEGGVCSLTIGDHNVFREYVSIHTATNDGDATIIGHHNYLLAFVHIGHDCILGDHIIVSAKTAIAGHVHIDDGANIGGNASIHQFCHIGAYAMVGGHSGLKKDVPPFIIAWGIPAVAKTYNHLGMIRNGFSKDECAFAKQIFKCLYVSNMNRSQAIEAIHQLPAFEAHPRIATLVSQFLQQPRVRGLI